MFHNTRVNYRLSILALLLGLFVTSATLITPAASQLANDSPSSASQLLASADVESDHG